MSEENTPENDAPEAAPVPEAPKADGTDWKAQARKWEARAKENAQMAKELEKLKAEKLSADEAAEAKAKAAEKRAEAALLKIAEAEARSVLTEAGIPNAKELAGDLNLSKYIVDGDVNSDAIAELGKRYAVKSDEPRAKAERNPAQGANGSKPNEKGAQITREQLKGMTPEQINAARKNGLLDNLLKGV